MHTVFTIIEFNREFHCGFVIPYVIIICSQQSIVRLMTGGCSSTFFEAQLVVVN